MWQSLYVELKDRNFIVIAVALDEKQAARPWIEAAKPSYPCVIDREHHVADLYNITNVPQAAWIDEEGRIVRPPENAGSSDTFRHMDRVTKQMTPGSVGGARTHQVDLRCRRSGLGGPWPRERVCLQPSRGACQNAPT